MTNEEVDRLLEQAVQEAAPNELYKYAFARLVAAAEREACARVCEHIDEPLDASAVGTACAAAIRARGLE